MSNKLLLNGGRISLLGVLVIIFPALLSYFGHATSFGLGTTLIACICLLTVLRLSNPIDLFNYNVIYLLLAALLLGFQSFMISLLTEIDLSRAGFSLFAMIIFCAGAASFACLLLISDANEISHFLRRALMILLLLGFLGGLGILQPPSTIFFKSVFPYTEPSLYALTLNPILASVCCLSSMRMRYFYIFSTFVVLLLLKSLTMAIGLTLVVLFVLPLTHSFFLLILLLPIIAFVDSSYYIDRFMFMQEDSHNLSALVYMQGWQMISDSFLKSYGFGVGYQQAGINSSEVDASLIIQDIVGGNLNLNDGSFVFSKLVSELGLISTIFLIPYFKSVIHSIKIIFEQGRVSNSNKKPIFLFASCTILCYLIDLFIRGTGYFTPSSFLMLVGMCILRKGGFINPLVISRSLLGPNRT